MTKAKTKPQPQPEERDAHARANASGWSETIKALVAALECDFDRLTELRDEREALADALKDAQDAHVDTSGDDAVGEAQKALADWDEANGEELRELAETAEYEKGYPFKSRDDVLERIQESPLSIQVRSGWTNPGEPMESEDFEILLSTGGPALRIMGELDQHKQPHRAWLEYQDWGTPWTEFHSEDAPSQDDLLTFCGVFYFGE